MLDFEAFGHSIDADQSKTPWPPSVPSTFAQSHSQTRPHAPSIDTPYTPAQIADSAGQDNDVLTGVDINMLETDYSWGMGTGMDMGLDKPGSNDGFGWLSGVGPGGNFFGLGIGNAHEGDLGFAPDDFWSVANLSWGVCADSQEIDTRNCSGTSLDRLP